MDDLKRKLLVCFAAVFPDMPADQIENATPSAVKSWDSVASVTLFATIEEEFCVEIDVQDMQGLVSFEQIMSYLQRNIPLKA